MRLNMQTSPASQPLFAPLEIFSATDTGRARANNEDSVISDESAGVLVLADGMGGYAAGEVAADMATSFIKSDMVDWLQAASSDVSHANVSDAMQVVAQKANMAIYLAANSNPQYVGMGTTLVMAVFRPRHVLIGHIGDSRAYRWRDGGLEQLTRDHSLLQEQIDAGFITPEQAMFSANRNLVTRAVGVEETVDLETHVHEMQNGDVYLFCSDGLTDMVTDREICDYLRQELSESLSKTAASLINAANLAGGRDNISVMLARVTVQPEAHPPRSTWWQFGRQGD